MNGPRFPGAHCHIFRLAVRHSRCADSQSASAAECSSSACRWLARLIGMMIAASTPTMMSAVTAMAMTALRRLRGAVGSYAAESAAEPVAVSANSACMVSKSSACAVLCCVVPCCAASCGVSLPCPEDLPPMFAPFSGVVQSVLPLLVYLAEATEATEATEASGCAGVFVNLRGKTRRYDEIWSSVSSLARKKPRR